MDKSISKRGSGAGQSADLEVNTPKNVSQMSAQRYKINDEGTMNGSTDNVSMSMRYSAEGDVVSSLDRTGVKSSPRKDDDSEDE